MGAFEVAADIQARKEVGLKKYGTVLQANNGRNSMLDAYQEGLDMANYLRQSIEEGFCVEFEYHIVLGMLKNIRSQLL